MAAISTSQFSVQQVRKRLKDLAARVSHTVASPSREAVHDLRISIRRLEPGLDVLAPCFAAERVKNIRQRLKDALELAGQVRDCDVALKVLSKARRRSIARLRTKVQSQRKEAANQLCRELESPWDTQLAAVHPHRKFNRRSAHTTALRELKRVAGDFFDSGDEAAASSRVSARRLHQFRIATKQFRYTLELFSPVLERPARALISKIREVQDRLGAVSNRRTARDVIASLGGEPSLEKDLKKKQHLRMKRFRRTWKDHSREWRRESVRLLKQRRD